MCQLLYQALALQSPPSACLPLAHGGRMQGPYTSGIAQQKVLARCCSLLDLRS